MSESFDTFDHFTPGLALGSYALRLKQQLADSDASLATDEQRLVVTITAPRLRFDDEDEVHASFPPAGGAANYHYTLPHLVFKRRALPWERKVGASSPWLALIVLSEAELVSDARITAMPAQGLAPDSDGVLRPVLDPPLDEEARAQPITVVELSEALFRQLCPTLDELPALTHVRQVDAQHKADAGGGRQDFAVLMAKRFPMRGNNTALLISLEGWDTWLAATTADEKVRVRAAVLHSWRFASVEDGGGTFKGRVIGVTGDPEHPGIHLAPLSIAVEASWDAAMRDALGQGFVPIAHQPEGASKTIAWYRGPLTPAPVEPLPEDGLAFDRSPGPVPFGTPAALDRELSADERAAQQDLSYASAWQLGRILALSSAGYGTAVRRWSHIRGLERMQSGAAANTRAFDLLDALADYLELHQTSDPAKATHPLLRDALTIAEWLGGLLRLAPVPLRYLVPSGRLLPAESMRSFHVDTNWTVDALTMGALSVGVDSLQAPLRRARGPVRAALWKLFRFHRTILHAAGLSTTAVPEPRAMSGVLLRSRLIHEYPGVELTLWHRETPITPLRLERLGDGTLLVLTYGAPDELRLREPREGLRFGCEQRRQLEFRREDGTIDPNKAIDLEHRFIAAGASHVLAVAALARHLHPADPRSGAKLAYQFMRRPTDITIHWEHP